MKWHLTMVVQLLSPGLNCNSTDYGMGINNWSRWKVHRYTFSKNDVEIPARDNIEKWYVARSLMRWLCSLDYPCNIVTFREYDCVVLDSRKFWTNTDNRGSQCGISRDLLRTRGLKVHCYVCSSSWCHSSRVWANVVLFSMYKQQLSNLMMID